MGFLSKYLIENRSESIVSLRNPPSWFIEMVGGGATASGIVVNEEKALSLTAVWACVDIISNTMATMPLHVNKRLNPKGKERAINHPLYKLIHDSPNSEQTSFQWRKLMNVHRLLWGAGISLIQFDNMGYPISLLPLPPWNVKPKRTTKGNLYYEYNDGKTIKLLQPWEVVVFTTLQTSDNWKSPITLHRETIATALAVKQYGAKTFGSGINPAGILSGVSFSDETTEESLRKKFGESYSGLNTGKKLMVLEEGVKFERVGIPPVDAQYLETMRFNVSEIARIYGVPLYMLADHEKQTSWGTGIEEQKDGYITFTILPIATQSEQELNKKVIKDDDYFCEYLTAGLLRGTMTNRMNAYQKGFAMGMYSPDDLREMENMNPLPNNEGTKNYIPMNFQPLNNSKTIQE
jgi:HK97 family phage portal protein